jgi:hypothetical protein
VNAAIEAGIDIDFGHVNQILSAVASARRAQLIELAGVCTADTLAAEVTAMVELWQTRTDELVDNLIPAEPEGIQNEAA